MSLIKKGLIGFVIYTKSGKDYFQKLNRIEYTRTRRLISAPILNTNGRIFIAPIITQYIEENFKELSNDQCYEVRMSHKALRRLKLSDNVRFRIYIYLMEVE